ncbi:MAG: DUF4239 domain-containing protein [Candidatus Eremiobacteraeota bacterium]|nr:DUF4239 domain-containing protein [Candidatus Eremiobacteraeota bacterium]
MDWVYDMPTWQYALIVVATSLCLACGSHVLFRRIVARDELLRHNDVAGFIASLVGVIYAVLLSFIVVVVWQEYDTAGGVAQKEASAVSDLYHLTYGYPQTIGEHLRTDLRRYSALMVEREWPQMQRGGQSSEAGELGHHILGHILRLAARTEAAAQLRSLSLTDIQSFFDARRDRLNQNQTSLPRILWTTLLIGGIVTVAFTFFFGMESARFQLTMTAGLTIVIAMMFVLIVELDFPFRGDTRVAPTMWTDVSQEMARESPQNIYRP